MRARWKLLRYRLEEWIVRAIADVIPRLPHSVAYQLAVGVGALAARLDWHGWEIALTNLEAAFGDRFSPAQRERIARESYQQFAATMVNLFWSPRLNRENFSELLEFEGLELLQDSLGAGNPRIFACLHYGDFELLSLASGWLEIESFLVTQEFKNPRLDPIFNHLRTRSGHQIVPRDGAIMRLYRVLQRGGSLAILIDFALQLHQPSVAIDCFGLKTSATFAHAWLANRTGAHIIPVHSEPLAGGRSRVIFHPEIEIPQGATNQKVAQLCWDRFESIVRQEPSPWMWMYKYWRYEPADATRPYPSYARLNPRFGDLIAQRSRRSHEMTRP